MMWHGELLRVKKYELKKNVKNLRHKSEFE